MKDKNTIQVWSSPLSPATEELIKLNNLLLNIIIGLCFGLMIFIGWLLIK